MNDWDDVAKAHDVLRRHYGDDVLPIHEVCDGIFSWLEAIHAEHYEGSGDEALQRIARAYDSAGRLSLTITAAKSNLLARLLYGRQPLRTRKCPEHKGVWSGIGYCEHGCGETGWLP